MKTEAVIAKICLRKGTIIEKQYFLKPITGTSSVKVDGDEYLVIYDKQLNALLIKIKDGVTEAHFLAEDVLDPILLPAFDSQKPVILEIDKTKPDQQDKDQPMKITGVTLQASKS